jgi:hypothetical protein
MWPAASTTGWMGGADADEAGRPPGSDKSSIPRPAAPAVALHRWSHLSALHLMEYLTEHGLHWLDCKNGQAIATMPHAAHDTERTHSMTFLFCRSISMGHGSGALCHSSFR